MAKTLSDLPEGNTPTDSADSLRDQQRQAEAWAAHIEDLLEETTFAPTAVFLGSVLRQIKDKQRISPAQIRAIEKIENQRDRPRREGRGGSRRYEGWTKGY